MNPTLTGYVLVSRLDRRTGQKGGGIALFARADVASQVVHIGDSLIHERSWHVVHVDNGPMLLGVWYRPPCRGEVQSIYSLEEELQLHGNGCMGTIIIGDMNVHEKQWFNFSTSSSPEGRCLRSICGKHNLVECVRAPTRGRNLLDLFLTDLPHLATTKVHAGVSDHFMVHAQMNFEVVGMRVQP